MNEITHIHLGRQPFTVAVDAHKELQDYLHDIKAEVGASHKEVIKEVELRMAELLAERGISGDKVVLKEDIAYLKEQLGQPSDFKEDDGQEHSEPADSIAPKRLFRDTQNGMIAGVAAGLAAYFNIDPIIVRLLFVVAVLAGAWGIPLYIIMWLLVPEAKTTSERLQMRGKPVTVDGLKKAVEQADIPGAARRASTTFRDILGRVGKVFLVLAGGFITLAGGLMLFAALITGGYMATHHGILLRDVAGILPGGRTQSVIGGLLLLSAAVISVFAILIGVAMARRRWQLPAWGVAALIGVLLLCIAGVVVTAPDAVSAAKVRYEAAQHSAVRTLGTFNEVQLIGSGAPVIYEPSDTYSVEFRYLGNADPSAITTSIDNGLLRVDVTKFIAARRCGQPQSCLLSDHITVVVHAPNLLGTPKDDRATGQHIIYKSEWR